MKLTDTHKSIIKELKQNPLDDNELAQHLKMKNSGMRARISELRTMGYTIERKYTLIEDEE